MSLLSNLVLAVAFTDEINSNLNVLLYRVGHKDLPHFEEIKRMKEAI